MGPDPAHTYPGYPMLGPGILIRRLLASKTQVKVGSVSLHRFAVFSVIKSVMAQRKNGTQNERFFFIAYKAPVQVDLYVVDRLCC